MTAVVAETDQGKVAKEPPAKPGKEETGNGTAGKPPSEVMWAWEQGLPRPEQLPGTNSQLLTPSLANAFGIQMMNGYRYPLPPPSQESGERANGESRAAQGSYHDPMGAAQMQASMPPPYANFHHSMPPPGSANAQAAAAAAMASAAMANPYGFPGMYQAPFGAQRPGGHYDPYGRSLGQGGDRGMGHSQGHLDPNVSFEHMMAYQAGMEHSRSFEAFKRSREEPGMSMGLEGSEDDHAHALKRPRLVWTPPLHKRFVDAVSHLGIKNAVPKTIMQLMNVEGLTRENVASHLQKYRLYLKRLQGCSESTMENSPSREGGGSGGGSGEGSGGDTGPGARHGGGSGGDGSGNEYKREGSGSEGNDGPGSGQGSGGGAANGGTGSGAHDGGGSGGSDGGSGKGNPAAQSEKGSGAGNASGGSGNGSGNGSDGGGQTQTLKASNKDGPQSQKTEPGAPAAPAATAQVNKGSTPQGNSGAAPTQAELEPGVDEKLKLKHTRQGSGSGGEGGASGGEGNGSDDGEERPNSMERASSGDGSNDGANEVDEPGRKGKLGNSARDAPATSKPPPATSKPPTTEDKKTKRTGKSTK